MNKMLEKENKKTKSSFFVMLRGVGIAMAATLIFLFIYSFVLANTNIKESTMSPVIIIITALSLLLGSSISSRKIKRFGILNGAIIGLIYMSIIYVLSSLLQTGFTLSIYSIIMMTIGVVAGSLGGILGVNLK